MVGRVLSFVLLAAAIVGAAFTGAVTVPIAGPYPALKASFVTKDLPPGTPQALQAESIVRHWQLNYLDDSHWELELVKTSNPAVEVAVVDKTVKSAGDYIEVDGTVLRAGSRKGGATTEAVLEGPTLPPYIGPATQDLVNLKKDAAETEFQGPEIAGRPTFGFVQKADISCRDLYAECTENAPPAFEALKPGTASQERKWYYDDATDFPMLTSTTVADVVVSSYEVDSLSLAES